MDGLWLLSQGSLRKAYWFGLTVFIQYYLSIFGQCHLPEPRYSPIIPLAVSLLLN